MKNLPVWTKTLAVASLTLVGAAACDSGNNTQTTAGSDQPEQTDGYVLENDINNIERQEEGVALEEVERLDNNAESTLERKDIDLYGQQNSGDPSKPQSDQTGDELSDQREIQRSQDDAVVQRD